MAEEPQKTYRELTIDLDNFSKGLYGLLTDLKVLDSPEIKALFKKYDVYVGEDAKKFKEETVVTVTNKNKLVQRDIVVEKTPSWGNAPNLCIGATNCTRNFISQLKALHDLRVDEILRNFKVIFPLSMYPLIDSVEHCSDNYFVCSCGQIIYHPDMEKYHSGHRPTD